MTRFRIGHHCVIGAGVQIGRGTRLENNVTINGNTRIGRNNHLFPNVVIGAEPQDLSTKARQPKSSWVMAMSSANRLRSIARRKKEDGITSVGNDCYFMTCST